MPVKPIVFGEQQVPVKKVAQGPVAVAFAPTPAKPPTQPTVVAGPKAANLAGINTSRPHQVIAPAPRPAFGQPVSPAVAQIVIDFKAKYPALYKANPAKIEQYIASLLPLRTEIVIDWAQKILEQCRDMTMAITRLVKQFTDAEGNDLCARTMKALQSGKGAWLRRTFADPLATVPALHVLTANLQRWLPECTQQIEEAAVLHQKLVERLAVISVVIDSSGTPTDTELERVTTQRRMIIQQSATQAELNVTQLEQMRQNMVAQRSSVDNIINVSIPAYQRAQAS